MKSVVIIGAGLMGREVSTYAREAGLDVRGFLDSRTHVLDGFQGYPPIIGTVEDYCIREDDRFVCAIGDPDVKRRYVEVMKQRGGAFESIVHPLAYVGQNSQIGKGCVIAPHATITNDTRLGDHVIVNVNASISHDCRIGSYSTISPGCNIAGICTLGEEVFLGVQSALIPSIALGKGVYVAAGAVVTRSFEEGRVMGVPARLK